MKNNVDHLKLWREQNKGTVIVRLTPVEKAKAKPQSLRLAITAFCWSCVGESRADVKNCTAKNCSLYPVRPWQGSEKDDE